MKQNFTHYFKSIILAIAFLLSWAIPAHSQNIQYVDKNNHQAYSENSKADVSELEQPFYCRIDDNMFSFLEVPNNTTEDYVYTISKKPITITDAKYGNILEEDIIGNTSKSSKALKLRIDNNEDSKILCYKTVNIDWIGHNTITFTIAVHDMPLVEEQPATCTSDGYRKYRCACCEEERTETLYALGHSYGEWQEMAGGHMRTCSQDANHKQYNMDATGVNALEITLTDETKLSYPSTLSPVVTFNDLDVAIGFDTDKTSLVNKADIKEYNQVWSHNKNVSTQNETDKTYKLKCDYESCGYEHTDLYVKNAGQYYVANKENGVIRVADMTLNDSEGYDCEADITVGNVSYSRDMKDNQWGTLCLPFAINPNDCGDCSFYQLNDVDETNSTIVLKQIDDEIIPAGVPVLVRCNDAVADISIAAENVPMSNSTQAGVTTGNFTLVGTLTTSDALGDDCYVISNDKFRNVPDIVANGEETTVTVSAFRAYLEAATPTAKIWNIAINNGTPTVIDVLNVIESGEMEIYDLSGRRLPDLQKGVNIVRQGNQTTKIFIK